MPATMILGKEKIIPIIAMSLLLVGTSSAIYVNETQIDKETIAINGSEYTVDQLFKIGTIKTIETDDGKKTGVALEELMYKFNINCPECSSYTIKGSDNYQQTVDWDIMKTGVLTDYRNIFFPHTAHYLWVKNIVEIEVN
jgi:hypothetical protein